MRRNYEIWAADYCICWTYGKHARLGNDSHNWIGIFINVTVDGSPELGTSS